MRPTPRYRVGATSFVHPAGWLANAARLAGRVRDVEILLFEPPSPASAPPPAEIDGLARLGRATGLTWSVHAPVVALASEDEDRRREAVDAIRRAVEITAPLDPHAVVVHVERDGAAGDLAGWRERATRSLRELVAAGIAPATLAIETLDYDFALVEAVVDALGLSVALDVGHLARDGVPLEPVLRRNLARTRVVQWHGTEPGGRDHRSLRHYPRAGGVSLLRALGEAGFAGVVTLEVFREDDLDDSLAVLAELEREAFAS
jgi:sugar phosphate isomerase/epimerase